MLGCVPAVVDPYQMRCSNFFCVFEVPIHCSNGSGDGKSDLPKEV